VVFIKSTLIRLYRRWNVKVGSKLTNDLIVIRYNYFRHGECELVFFSEIEKLALVLLRFSFLVRAIKVFYNWFADIDECAATPSSCVTNADCTNTPGSFICTCRTGYTGNGRAACTGKIFYFSEKIHLYLFFITVTALICVSVRVNFNISFSLLTAF